VPLLVAVLLAVPLLVAVLLAVPLLVAVLLAVPLLVAVLPAAVLDVGGCVDEDGGWVWVADAVWVADEAGGVVVSVAGGVVVFVAGGVVVLVAGGVVITLGVGVVVVGVGVGTWIAWHCQMTGELVTVPPTPPPGVVAAMLSGANAALATKPAAAVKSVPPAMRPIATGRTRAKHM
jgi:hypothetical protein